MSGQEGLVGTLEWFAETGGVVASIGALTTFVAVKYNRHRLGEIEAFKATLNLPDIGNIDGARLITETDKLPVVSDASTLLAPVLIHAKAGIIKDECWYSALQECTDNMRGALESGYARRTADVVDAAHILDEALPISEEDTLTPQDPLGERHWFEFVWAQARDARFRNMQLAGVL